MSDLPPHQFEPNIVKLLRKKKTHHKINFQKIKILKIPYLMDQFGILYSVENHKPTGKCFIKESRQIIDFEVHW